MNLGNLAKVKKYYGISIGSNRLNLLVFNLYVPPFIPVNLYSTHYVPMFYYTRAFPIIPTPSSSALFSSAKLVSPSSENFEKGHTSPFCVGMDHA